jgi:hypothetical protein
LGRRDLRHARRDQIRNVTAAGFELAGHAHPLVARRWIAGDSFRVTMNNFLATGGDGFTVFLEGTSALGGALDIDAFVAYFGSFGAAGIPVPALDRIVAKP